MKKIKSAGLLILVSIFTAALWVACEKETTQTNDSYPVQKILGQGESQATEYTTTEGPSCITYYNQIQIVNGMLSFTNIQHFEAVVLCLERDVDAHNDAFEAIYGEYSDEALEKMEDSLNFDEDQPLIDLENNFGFFSLRKHIEDKMEV